MKRNHAITARVRIRAARSRRWAAWRAVTFKAGALGVLAAGAVAGYVQLARSESLAISSIVVEGTSPERAEEIKGLLNLKAGENLLFADLKAARARAEGHPWVASCAVKRELPDTLRLVVEERVPLLVLALDRLYYVDREGQPFKALMPGDDYDLPVLTGLSREDLLERGDVARPAIAGALDLLAQVGKAAAAESGSLSLEDVSEIAWDEDRGYSVVTLGGRTGFTTIRFGSGDFVEKLARLRQVRKSASGGMKDAPRSIDLTYASRVIVAR